MRRPPRVFVCSPYNGDTAADIARNVRYAKRAIVDSLARGEAPFAPHLLYPDALVGGETPANREQGISAGLAWLDAADRLAVYTDHGISAGMERETMAGQLRGMRLDIRTIGPEPGCRLLYACDQCGEDVPYVHPADDFCPECHNARRCGCGGCLD